MENVTTPASLSDCDFPNGGCDTLRTIKKVFLSLAIICDVLTLIAFVILRKYRFFNQRIFCNILVANLLSAITTIGNDAHPSKAQTSGCIAQAFFIQTFDFVLFMWICCLTLYLFLNLIKSKDTARYEWVYIAVCWIVPIVIACLPLTTSDYGLASSVPYCWIKNTGSGTAWRFAIFWVPVFGGVLVILFLFIYMIWRASVDMNHYKGSQDPQAMAHTKIVRDYLRPFTAWAASFVILHLVQFINRVHNAVHAPAFSLVTFHLICSTLYGVVLCALFVLTNGREEFTRKKFIEGLHYHKKRLRGEPSESPIREYHVGDDVPSTVPRHATAPSTTAVSMQDVTTVVKDEVDHNKV